MARKKKDTDDAAPDGGTDGEEEAVDEDGMGEGTPEEGAQGGGEGAFDPSSVPDLPDAVAQLMELVDKCSTFSAWVEKARGAGGDFKSEIVKKVVGDYLEKWTDVIREMQPHIQEIQQTLDEERDAPVQIQEELSKQELEREELKLRNMIGELDDKDFEELDAEMGGDIDKLREQIEAMTARRDALDGSLQRALAAHRLLEEAGGTLPEEAAMTGVEVQIVQDASMDGEEEAVEAAPAEEGGAVEAPAGDEEDEEAVEAEGGDDVVDLPAGAADGDAAIDALADGAMETVQSPGLQDAPKDDGEPPIHSTAEWQESIKDHEGGAEGMTATARLVMKPKQGAPSEYGFNGEVLSIGRGRNNDIQIKHDGKVSRYHCRIVFKSGQYLIEDNKSSNGTIVNGRAITRKKLEGGETIVIGETNFTFHLE